MEGEREIVAHPGNFVVSGGLAEEGVGAGAVGALHVFEFNDGHVGSGGGLRAEGSWTWVPAGGAANWARAGGGDQQRGKGKGRQQGGVEREGEAG